MQSTLSIIFTVFHFWIVERKHGTELILKDKTRGKLLSDFNNFCLTHKDFYLGFKISICIKDFPLVNILYQL